MRIVNTSTWPEDRLKQLLKFAAKGVRDEGIEVHIKSTPRQLRGWFYEEPPGVSNISRTSRHLITLLLPRNAAQFPTKTWASHGLKRITTLWPDGIPLEGWEDGVIFIAAHEFRHAWQAHRRSRRKKGGKGEYDADKHAYRIVNKWREATGRQPVAPLKQANPFTRAEKST